jgi:hypothetical protein
MTVGRRLYSETLDIPLPIERGVHHLTVSFVYDDSEMRALREIAFVRRGKSGGGLDQLFVQLGVMLSRALQRRDPVTGDPIDGEGHDTR